MVTWKLNVVYKVDYHLKDGTPKFLKAELLEETTDSFIFNTHEATPRLVGKASIDDMREAPEQ